MAPHLTYNFYRENISKSYLIAEQRRKGNSEKSSSGNKIYSSASQLLFNPLCEDMRETFTELDCTLQKCKYYDEREFLNLGTNKSKDISLLSMNINGLQNKQDDIQ